MRTVLVVVASLSGGLVGSVCECVCECMNVYKRQGISMVSARRIELIPQTCFGVRMLTQPRIRGYPKSVYIEVQHKYIVYVIEWMGSMKLSDIVQCHLY